MTGAGRDVVAQANRFMPGVERPGAQFFYDWNAPLPRDDRPCDAECSNLVWSAVRFGGGVEGFPDGSWTQFSWCDVRGGRVPVEQAVATPGALMFKTRGNAQVYPPLPGRRGIVHVAVAVGDGRTVYEACCRTGDPIRPRRVSLPDWYRFGALVPGVRYEHDVPPPPAAGGAVIEVEGGGTVALRVLRKGAEGRDVRQMQALVAEWQVDVGRHDGQFGGGTERAVKQFQQARGLAVDGVVGPATWRSLLGAA